MRIKLANTGVKYLERSLGHSECPIISYHCQAAAAYVQRWGKKRNNLGVLTMCHDLPIWFLWVRYFYYSLFIQMKNLKFREVTYIWKQENESLDPFLGWRIKEILKATWPQHMLRNEIRNRSVKSYHPLGPRDSLLAFRTGWMGTHYGIRKLCFGNPTVLCWLYFL